MRHQTSTSRTGCHQHSCHCVRGYMATNSTVAQTMHRQTARSRLAVTNTPLTVREDTWQQTRLREDTWQQTQLREDTWQQTRCCPNDASSNSKVKASCHQHSCHSERGGHMATNSTSCCLESASVSS